MGFSRHFFPEYQFAFTQCYGIVDDNSLRIHILSFNLEAKGMTYIRELADARKLDNVSNVTVQGLVQLSELGKERSAGRRGLLAIVVARPLIYEMARIYAGLLTDIKKDTRIFYDVKEALSWLDYDGQEIDRLIRYMGKHRV
ncbi:hypothetical protein DSCA_42490 [Desulfosarcina alkanivorans]|uniref:STAS/SEC14 domain-containing protein n=1 Tax=Desulfosarcina alkanivorans TaxID=571177 RepID=A0A5K7YQZ0_9BACT|nr:hypothetical protein [Desulfosarcina alkanivorans]BBO70319.1 hypothetical protein DSCA_42490 [Desulfosarcina alkanivorans]